MYDELYKFQDKLTHILTRHEQGATHAAQGYARVSGRVGVAIATSGPGATNLVTGLADAQIDSTPMVCLTGQVTRELLGTDAFQETDIIGISTPVTKWNYQITKASEIPEVMAKAFYIAKSGRPGPVLIDITKNAQIEKFEFSYKKCTVVRSYKPVPKPEISAIDTDHRLNVGMVGMHGNYGPNLLTNECDVLLAIGMRFDDRVTGRLADYATQAKVIHFEIDPAEINKNVHADVAVLGNSKDTLGLLLPLIKENKHEAWHNIFKEKYQIEYDTIINNDIHPTKPGLTMGEVIEEINLASNNKAVIVSDVGQHQMIACRYAKFSQTKSNITSGGLGTMGFALPAAIGAKMGAMDREVVAIIGDGGFQMTIQELGVIFQHKVPVKIVVLNNEHLGMVRQWQELFFEKRYASTVMVNPDFVKIAEGYSIEAKRVSERKDLKSTIQKMMASKEPYFLEVKVEQEDNVFPMIPSGASVSEVRLKK